MAFKRKRGNTWNYVVRRKGLLPKPIYLTFDNEKDGDEYVARLEKTLDAGVVPPGLIVEQPRDETIGEAISAFIDAASVPASDRSLLDVLDGRIGDVKVSTVTYVWVENWVAGMKRESGLSPSTIRHYVGALARCFDWCVRQGKLPANPLRMLPKRYATYNEKDAQKAKENGLEARVDIERDRRLFPDEERAIRAILDGAKPEGKERALTLKWQGAQECMLDLALETGMRMRETYTLTLDQVSIENRTIFLDRTKNGDGRQVPLTSEAITALERYFAQVKSGKRGMVGFSFQGDRLFPWWNGSLSDTELRRVTSRLSRQFGRVFESAKCDDLNYHDLRHEFTCRLYLKTKLSDVAIAKILGWRTLRLAMRYASLRGSELASQMW